MKVSVECSLIIITSLLLVTSSWSPGLYQTSLCQCFWGGLLDSRNCSSFIGAPQDQSFWLDSCRVEVSYYSLPLALPTVPYLTYLSILDNPITSLCSSYFFNSSSPTASTSLLVSGFTLKISWINSLGDPSTLKQILFFKCFTMDAVICCIPFYRFILSTLLI